MIWNTKSDQEFSAKKKDILPGSLPFSNGGPSVVDLNLTSSIACGRQPMCTYCMHVHIYEVTISCFYLLQITGNIFKFYFFMDQLFK